MGRSWSSYADVTDAAISATPKEAETCAWTLGAGCMVWGFDERLRICILALLVASWASLGAPPERPCEGCGGAGEGSPRLANGAAGTRHDVEPNDLLGDRMAGTRRCARQFGRIVCIS